MRTRGIIKDNPAVMKETSRIEVQKQQQHNDTGLVVRDERYRRPNKTSSSPAGSRIST